MPCPGCAEEVVDLEHAHALPAVSTVGVYAHPDCCPGDCDRPGDHYDVSPDQAALEL